MRGKLALRVYTYTYMLVCAQGAGVWVTGHSDVKAMQRYKHGAAHYCAAQTTAQVSK